MPHVTFIHGIANKPEPDKLIEIWRRALADRGLDLGGLGVTSDMVYWADVLYAEPDADSASHESASESSVSGIDAAGGAEFPDAETEEEAAFIKSLQAKLMTGEETAIVDDATKTGDLPLERVPLPWFIKRRFLKAFLRDVHHYLFNTEYEPRNGVRYKVQDEIRQRFVEKLSLPVISPPHIVVSHSMGTVIAYDCVKRFAQCPSIDGLVTIGSPLGLDEIQDKLQPGWSRNDGFPSEKVDGDWVNVFDRLDVVAAADPVLANDYKKSGSKAVEDISVSNSGIWRHSSTKYLRDARLVERLEQMLDL